MNTTTRLLTLALIFGMVSLNTACNRSREESHDTPSATSQPGQIPQAQESPGFNRGVPIRPAGDPNVIAPPRTEPTSADWGEGAGVAAGHTK